jgi:hypothetical protein
MLVVGVLVRMLWRLFDRNEKSADKREEKYAEFMAAFTSSLNAMTVNLQATRVDSLQTIRDTRDNILSGVQAAIRLSHDEAKIERKELIEQAMEKVSDEITGVANSIRASNEKLAATFEKRLDDDEKKRLLAEQQRLLEENRDLSREHDEAAPRPVR